MKRLTTALLGIAFLAGCGGPAAPPPKPATHAEAVKAMGAVDSLDQHFPKELVAGQWCRFNARRQFTDAWIWTEAK